MKYSLTFEVVDPDLWKTKYTIDVEESRSILFNQDSQTINFKHNSTLGLAIEIFIKNNDVFIKNKENQNKVLINNSILDIKPLLKGDQIVFGDYKIDTIEIEKKQYNEAETQFVDISKIKSNEYQKTESNIEINIPKQKTNIYLEKNKVFSVKTPEEKNSKINPRMIKIAGSITAGVLLLAGVSYQYYNMSRVISEQTVQIKTLSSVQTKDDTTYIVQIDEIKAKLIEKTEELEKNKKIIEEQRLAIVQMEKELQEDDVNIERKKQIKETKKIAKIKKINTQKKIAQVRKVTKHLSEDFLLASKSGDMETIKECLKEDKNIINAKDKNGNTALIWAAAKNNSELIKLLLKAGSRVDSKNSKNRTAIDFAKHNQFKEIVNILNSHQTRQIASQKKKR